VSADARPVGVSVLLLAYNQERTVEVAARSCLAQQGGPYDIVLSDDASTDSTFARLQALAAAYRGPHRLRLRRSERNLGIAEHYNRLVADTTGELLVTAAGDDISLPQRVLRLAAAWDATGRRADLIASHVVDMAPDGSLHGTLRVDDLAAWRSADDWAAKRPHVIGAGHAFTRRVMERFGPLAPDVPYEDQIVAFRAIVSGGGVTVDEALVHYRRGGDSSGPRFPSVEAMRRSDLRRVERDIAEMRQLQADGAAAGCSAQVAAVVGPTLVRDQYLLDVRAAASTAARWRAFRARPQLPTAWRLRKLLHAAFPATAFRLRRSALWLRGLRR
jgi:glycosyltransferase involved in cell wall biosynthesis